MNALVYVDIDQGIHKEKLKNARKEKRKKLHVFSYTKNITNFKAFRWNNLLSAKLLLLKSVNSFFNQKIVVYIGTLHTYY